jgi:hypothetical protein
MMEASSANNLVLPPARKKVVVTVMNYVNYHPPMILRQAQLTGLTNNLTRM